MSRDCYDIVVVGAGHAGCEAAAAAANMGSKVLLITMNMQNIAQMSCNPAMGGIAKGQIIREIDALGGYSGIVTNKSMIQFRMLNKSKGPAMWSPRAQCDRMLFSSSWRNMLENTPNLDFYQDMVKELIVESGIVRGVSTLWGKKFYSKAVILTNGTFLNGVVHIGENHVTGGRISEKASVGLTEQLVSLGFISNRLKTGTPPRVDGRSLNYCEMEEQKGDADVVGFSFKNMDLIDAEMQKSCFITYTNSTVHDILRTGFSRSPMFQGRIQGRGPRYCPSIEDKINRFSDKDRHQLFAEPEGWDTCEIYVNGFSTSLPEDVQREALGAVKGFEDAKFFRPGYAIEYDFFPPTQLNYTLETKPLKNLFFAGQINGTTGYEEAAGQGIMAGINAHLKISGRDQFILKRNEAYIGVLIDDLISKGTDEPYRMFTSRAEFRTLLRQDNADLRLTPLSFNLGLANTNRMESVKKKQNEIVEIKKLLKEVSLDPDQINNCFSAIGSAEISEKQKAEKLLLRPGVDIRMLFKANQSLSSAFLKFDPNSLNEAEIQIKYQRYIEKEKLLANKMLELENLKIPDDFDYEKINALSSEGRQKLGQIRPSTVGQAERISGVSPSDIQVLIVFMGR